MYNLCRTEKDYAIVQEFLKGTPFERLECTFPTVLAYRYGNLVGVLGTRPSDEAVIAGPLCIKSPPPEGAYVALRLIEFYDATLKALGIVQYVFPVEKKNAHQLDMISRAGFKPYAERAGNYWFKRWL